MHETPLTPSSEKEEGLSGRAKENHRRECSNFLHEMNQKFQVPLIGKNAFFPCLPLGFASAESATFGQFWVSFPSSADQLREGSGRGKGGRDGKSCWKNRRGFSFWNQAAVMAAHHEAATGTN